MTQQSCCNNKDVITFHPSIVCSGEEYSDCSNALYGCTNLKTVYVPSTINYISPSMFQAATSIQAVYIQDGVVGIGHRVSVTSFIIIIIIIIIILFRQCILVVVWSHLTYPIL